MEGAVGGSDAASFALCAACDWLGVILLTILWCIQRNWCSLYMYDKNDNESMYCDKNLLNWVSINANKCQQKMPMIDSIVLATCRHRIDL